ncbi:unnamed protein product [Owenia fusiformis]|uniref:palmitoyl-protein hydrolase n=1 Tax=Owenia fusiformis TaxID=6347 RepID=A0A8S4MYJ6_OWEFU|nr:unnamed protein product [Owenia fusiformis]
MGANSSRKKMSSPTKLASSKHTATVIFLHGLGDTGHGWLEAFTQIAKPHIKYICPNAPTMPVSLNGGFEMPSWFDIKGLDPKSPEDEDGIKKAAKSLQDIISEEETKNNIKSDRIIVGGFSQGGAVALYSALTTDKPLAGILGLSTWLPLHKSFPQAAIANLKVPMLQCHGTMDPMVSYEKGKLTAAVLKTMLENHEFKSYEYMGHSFCEQEMQDVQVFIDKVLPHE